MSLAVRVPALALLLVAALRAGTVAGAGSPDAVDQSTAGARASGEGPAGGGGVLAAAAGSDDARSSVVVLGARTLFATNVASLSAAGERALGRLVDELVDRHVAHDSLVGIHVVGHTDGLGTDVYNLRLSKRRAASVGAFIAARHPAVAIVLEGGGERFPVASDASAAGRARNRRVELRVVALERR